MSLPQKINVLAELERCNVKYTFAGSEHVKCVCPFHMDHSPSCSVNVETGGFKCFTCKETGDFLKFLSKTLGQARSLIHVYLLQRYDLGDEPSVDPNAVEKWHGRIWDAKPLLKELYDRGVTDDMIRQYRLGEKDGRVTIPVRNAGGLWVNVRMYLPGAPGANKMKNMKGRSKPRLFPLEQLRFDDIAILGGEVKAIVAAAHLNPHGMGAIGTTAGEGNWDQSFTDALMGKRLWLVGDTDAAGKADSLMKARTLSRVSKWIGVTELPLDPEKYPKGDVNDFIGREHGDLWKVIQATEEWQPPSRTKQREDEEPLVVSMNAAYSAMNTKRRMTLDAVVSAIADSTYPLPRKVQSLCSRGQECCGMCEVFTSRKDEFYISPEDPVILELIDENKRSHRPALMEALGVPPNCPEVQFDVLEFQQADDVRISPRLEVLSRASERTLQRVICVREGLQLNENYKFTGRQFPHPRDQSATLLVSKYESSGDALDDYKIKDRDALQKFRPSEWTVESLADKLDDIYADFEYNVTYIRQRRAIHLAMDVVWHSPLFYTFDGRVEKGYAEVLVLGDSSQGKSVTTQRMLAHYGAGAKVECKNATVAGLLGGVQQLNGRHFVSWGVIPSHDRRAMILEEVKGMEPIVISKLTDMRSSGFAEIPKIEKRRTMARTRLLWLSNPRSQRPLSSYAFGIEAVKELIGALEDVRRFDFCLLVSKDEISEEVANQAKSEWPVHDHVYDSDSCKDLILWTWTRSESQVRFSPEAEALTLKHSTTMCKTFSDEIPIVDPASMRYKIGRVAAALAARTYSTADDDEDTILVRDCHVQYAFDFMMNTYSSPVFGYLDFTKATQTQRVISDEAAVERALRGAMYSRDLVENMLRTTRFDHQDIQDWCGLGRDEAQALVSLLARKRALVRDGRPYVKTPGMIDLLKRLTAEGLPEVPDHIKKESF